MKRSLIYKLFGVKGSLSRDDVNTYGSSMDESVKQTIEEKSLASDFDADAFEGWKELDYDTAVMRTLDKRFIPKNYTLHYIITSIVLLSAVIAFVALYDFTGKDNAQDSFAVQDVMQEDTLPDQVPTTESFKVEEEDIIINEAIEKMQEVLPAKQVQPKTIKEDFVLIDSFNKLHPDDTEDLELPNLTVEEIDQGVNKDISRSKKAAKEVYLSDFKLIDYRAYRSKPEINTKQLTLSGTPAYSEEKNGIGTSEPETEWKDVQIPYIEYIGKSMRIFSKNNFKKSLSRFETVLNTYPDDANALFYGGLCLYNLGEYDKALNYFIRCRSGIYNNFDEEVQWLTGLCYENLGNSANATKIFTAIVDKGGFYAEQANKKLKK